MVIEDCDDSTTTEPFSNGMQTDKVIVDLVQDDTKNYSKVNDNTITDTINDSTNKEKTKLTEVHIPSMDQR